jgi:hypothetical protein
MTSEEVMELIQGDKPMAEEAYETLTREEVLELLELHNALDDMLDDASEMFDVNLSQLAALSKQMHRFRNRFQFRPQKSDTGDHPAHWKPHVLKEDDRAWYYQGDD